MAITIPPAVDTIFCYPALVYPRQFVLLRFNRVMAMVECASPNDASQDDCFSGQTYLDADGTIAVERESLKDGGFG